MATRKALKAYLDTSVIVSLILDREPPSSITKMLQDAQKNNYKLLISDLALLELTHLSQHLGTDQRNKFESALRKLLALDMVRLATPKLEIGKLREKLQALELKDALHLQAARNLGADFLVTRDNDLLKLKIDSPKVVTPDELLRYHGEKP